MGAALVAVAAALLLWLRVRPPPAGPGVTAAPLPAFRMTVRNDTAGQIRRADSGQAQGPAPYRLDSRVHWTFQPEEPTRGELELAAIVRQDDDDIACLRRLPVSRASPDGVLEVRGEVEPTFGLGPGQWTLELIVARAGALPADDGECTHPRDLPCPCPERVHAGASIEPARLEPEPEPESAGWRRIDAYSMQIEPR